MKAGQIVIVEYRLKKNNFCDLTRNENQKFKNLI